MKTESKPLSFEHSQKQASVRHRRSIDPILQHLRNILVLLSRIQPEYLNMDVERRGQRGGRKTPKLLERRLNNLHM